MQPLQVRSARWRIDAMLLLGLIGGIGLLWGITYLDTFDPSFQANVAKAVHACQDRVQTQWGLPAETRYTDGQTSQVTSANDTYHVTIWEVVPDTASAAQPGYACVVQHIGRRWMVEQAVSIAP